MLEEGKTLHGKSYDYTINKKLASDFFLGVLKVRGDLGQIDSGFAVDITTSERDSSGLIETISHLGQTVYIYTHSSSQLQSQKDRVWTPFGQHKYRGQMQNGVPHGKGEMRWQNCSTYSGDWRGGVMHGTGIMTWPSGKKYEGQWQDNVQEGRGIMFYPNGNIYEGTFHHGVRHGQGILRQPNGGYFEGRFENDQLSERMTFVDSQGVKHEHTKVQKLTEPSLLMKIWNKTWRLWAALACFGLAVLFAAWVADFFSGDGPSRMSVKGLLAPIALSIFGFKLLIEFFANILPDK